MDPHSILETHAEVAIALGGFASVVAALGRPLDRIRRQRFMALLFLSLVQVFSSLLPVWLADFVGEPARLWRIASLVYFSVAVVTITATVVIPLRRIGVLAVPLLSVPVTILVNVLSAVSVLMVLVNGTGLVWTPSFAVYYASLLLGFCLGFVLFADVVLRDDET